MNASPFTASQLSALYHEWSIAVSPLCLMWKGGPVALTEKMHSVFPLLPVNSPQITSALSEYININKALLLCSELHSTEGLR